MTLQRTLFTLYGTIIGLAYIAALAIAWPLSIILTVVLAVVVVGIFSYYGNRLPKAAKMSDWQLLVAIPLVPFAILGGIIAFGFLFPLVAVMWPYAAIRATLAEHHFRRVMQSKGRFVSFDDLHPRLMVGEGTLIEEMGLKAPYRLWWTQDDLFTLGSPASTREDFIAIYEGNGHSFNSRCLAEYLDEESGRGSSGDVSKKAINELVDCLIEYHILDPYGSLPYAASYPLTALAADLLATLGAERAGFVAPRLIKSLPTIDTYALDEPIEALLGVTFKPSPSSVSRENLTELQRTVLDVLLRTPSVWQFSSQLVRASELEKYGLPKNQESLRHFLERR
jgi:phosphate/sulfate permease